MARKVYDVGRIRAIAEKIRALLGVEKTYTTAEMPGGIDEVFNTASEIEKKRWWGIYQENGNRASYHSGFYFWPVNAIDPQFDITPTNATNMFNNTKSSDGKNISIPEISARNNIVFNFNKCNNFAGMITYGAVEDLGFVDMTAGTGGTNSAFANSNTLKRLSIAIKEDGSQNFYGAFDYTSAIEDLTIVSGVFGSNLNFQWSTKLTHDSLMSIINHLQDKSADTSGTTWIVTIGSTNYAKLTDEEIEIANKKGWDIR